MCWHTIVPIEWPHRWAESIESSSIKAVTSAANEAMERSPVAGERPATADLVIKSQGCNDDIGICYPPQTWSETVSLRQAASSKLQLGNLGQSSAMSEFPPVDEVFFPDVFPVDGNKVEFGIRIVPGFYIYKDKVSVRSLSDDALFNEELLAKTLHLSASVTELDGALESRGYRLLSKVPRLTPTMVDEVVDKFENLDAILGASASELEEIDGIDPFRARSVKESLTQLVETSILDRLQRG